MRITNSQFTNKNNEKTKTVGLQNPWRSTSDGQGSPVEENLWWERFVEQVCFEFGVEESVWSDGWWGAQDALSIRSTQEL